jgi:hypothetical protein
MKTEFDENNIEHLWLKLTSLKIVLLMTLADNRFDEFKETKTKLINIIDKLLTFNKYSDNQDN